MLYNSLFGCIGSIHNNLVLSILSAEASLFLPAKILSLIYQNQDCYNFKAKVLSFLLVAAEIE